MTDSTIVPREVAIRRGAALRQSSCHPSSCLVSPMHLSIALLAGLALLLTPRVAFSCNPPDPVIACSPYSLAPSAYEGQSPAAQTFRVWNFSAGTLNYTISKNQTWLSVSPTSGSSTGEYDTITVSYNTASLAEGTYNAAITIADPYASNSPQTVSVTLTINAAPLVILHGGQSASGQTFCVPFSAGHVGQYYRDLAGLSAAAIVDQDEKREWADTDWGPWTAISDTTHPAPAWSYSPSGTITAPCTLTVTCAWTDDNSPADTQDAQQSDWAAIIVGVPIAPDELSATPISSRRIDLTWTDNATDETGYRVFRSTDGLHFTQIAQIAANSAYFKDRNLSAAAKYYYRVRAYNAQGSSDYSNTADATTLDAPFFLETWNSTFWPVHPDDSFTTNSTGAVYAADEPWTWTTENGSVQDCAFRAGDDAHEIGRFSAGTQAGDFTLSAPAGSLNLTESEDVSLFALFQVTIDQTGADSGRRFALEYRNETSFNVSAPTYVSIWLDGETGQPALHIQSSDEGQSSNAIEAPLGIGGYGGAGTYRVEATFSPSEQGLDVAYSITDEDAPETPVLSGSDTLDQTPSANLHQLQLVFQQRSVAALDDISLTSEGETGAPAPPPQQSPAETGDPITLTLGDTGNRLDGYELDGVPQVFEAGDLAGHALSALGDVNGDGYEDVIIGAPGRKGSDYPWSPWAGEAYLVFGSAAGPAEGLRLKPAHAGSPPIFSAGYSVAGIGDFNGDGYNDFAIGAPWALSDNTFSEDWDAWDVNEGADVEDPSLGYGAGEVYLIYGGASLPDGGLVSLSEPDPAVGTVFEGLACGDNTGHSVAGAGDVDGDGYSDLLIGAPNADLSGKADAGKAYLVFGGSATEGNDGLFDFTHCSSEARFLVFEGAAAGEHTGWSVAGVGDVNGDGLADILIGAPDADAPVVPPTNPPTVHKQAGKAYLVFGSKTFNLDWPFQLGALDGGAGIIFQGAGGGDHAGWTVSGAGNVVDKTPDDPGGLADFLIGAPDASPSGTENSGRAYLVYGKTAIYNDVGKFKLVADMTEERGVVFVGAAAGDRAGASVSAAGDANGDGTADVLIGAPGADPGYPAVDGAGEVDVIYGEALGSASQFQLPPSAYTGVRFPGSSLGEALGRAVSDAGDLDGDGNPDFVAGGLRSVDLEGEARFLTGYGLSVDHAAYRSYCPAGDAPALAIGAVSLAVPPSRCWIDFEAGTAASQAIVDIWRDSSRPSGYVAPGSACANIVWHISSSRSSNAGAATFKILEQELSGLSEGQRWALRLYRAGDSSGWTWTAVEQQTYDRAQGLIRGRASDVNGYYALAVAAGNPLEEFDIYPPPYGLLTIQSALDNAVDGAVITVHPGTYFESIKFKGKNVTLCSEDPSNPSATVLDGSWQRDAALTDSVVVFDGTETDQCRLEGFTIQNGATSGAGGGIRGNHTQAAIVSNLIQRNCAGGAGGGIWACDGLMAANLIGENQAVQRGGGLADCSGTIMINWIGDNDCAGSGGGLANCNGRIENSIVYRNKARLDGGGLYQCWGSICNNTVWANSAAGNGGGLAFCGSGATIANSIVWDNTGTPDAQIDQNSSLPAHCCIEGWDRGGTGNTAADPLLLFPGNGNFRLDVGSSCIDQGTAAGAPGQDWEGDDRPFDASVDIGADEYTGEVPPGRVPLFYAWPDDDEIGRVDFDVWTVLPERTCYYRVYSAPDPHGPYTFAGECYEGIDEWPLQPVAYVPPGPRYYWTATAVNAASGLEGGSCAPDEGTPLRIIMLDPGHGGPGSKGAIGLDSRFWGGGDPWVQDATLPVEERLLCRLLAFDVSWRLSHLPSSMRIRVESTRALTYDYAASLSSRPLKAYDYSAVLFLSIHFNASGRTYLPQPNGMETFYYPLTWFRVVYDDLTYPGFDQCNYGADHSFANRVALRAGEFYNKHAATKVQFMEPSGEKALFVLRDSLLTGCTTQDDLDYFDCGQECVHCAATLLEVNYIRNTGFHEDWNDGPRSTDVRSDTADGIVNALVEYLDKYYWMLRK